MGETNEDPKKRSRLERRCRHGIANEYDWSKYVRYATKIALLERSEDARFGNRTLTHASKVQGPTMIRVTTNTSPGDNDFHASFNNQRATQLYAGSVYDDHRAIMRLGVRSVFVRSNAISYHKSRCTSHLLNRFTIIAVGYIEVVDLTQGIK